MKGGFLQLPLGQGVLDLAKFLPFETCGSFAPGNAYLYWGMEGI